MLAFAMLTATALPAQNSERKLTVEELFGLVETGSRQLMTRKASEEAASQGVEVAKAGRLPDVNASLSASYIGNVLMTNRHLGDAHGYHAPHLGNSFALEAQQIVYAGGAVDAAVRMADLQHEAAIASTEEARQQQRFLALGQFLDIYKLDRRVQVFDENMRLTQQLIGQIAEKHRQGMALRNDITRYELQMETLRLGKKKLEDQRAILNYELCRTLGLADGAEIVPQLGADDAQAATAGDPSLGAWQADARSSSPVLRQTALGIELSKTEERLARSAMRPTVALFAAESFDGPITFEIPPIDKNLNTWFVGVGIRYSISSLFKSNRKVKQAQSATRRSELAHQAAAEQVENQMQQAAVYYRQAFVELETRQKSVQLAAQNYDVMSERYANQLALVTDMVDASNLKLNAELDEVDARVGITYAYYRMKFIAGKL